MVPQLKYRGRGCCRIVLPVVLLCLFLFFPEITGAVSDLEMTGFRITQETDSGRWEINAGKASFDGHGDVILREVSARMLADGRERVAVVSDRGLYESKGLILHLEGNVAVDSAWGSRLKTQSLEWDGPRALMLADRGVRLTRDGLEITGQSIRYTVNTGEALVYGRVRTIWKEGSTFR